MRHPFTRRRKPDVIDDALDPLTIEEIIRELETPYGDSVWLRSIEEFQAALSSDDQRWLRHLGVRW